MARIPQHFIDHLLERTDIVSLIDSRVGLKKAGREYTACCPFHEEKTPSFTVSPSKQFYHCFGCGAHGSAISFLMEYDRLEFRDAVETLADLAGMDLPEQALNTPDYQGPPKAPLLEAMRRADRCYRRALRSSQKTIEYLKNRGVSGEIAQYYGLGYAPPEWDTLGRQLPDRQAGAQAGLLIERHSGGYFDRFRDRLMFPIRDTRGRTIAFGGRTLGDDQAKYLNSPETPLFHKSNHMYGLYEARQAQRHIQRLLVVEGYMDVIALAQHGFPNAVATLGTATTESHLRVLFRHTNEIIFCFDGDAAGVRAARRALEHSLTVMRGTRRVRFLFLPEGQDPDDLVRGPDGHQQMQTAIDKAQPASKVLLDGLTEGLDLNIADDRAQLVERARQPITSLPPNAFRSEMIQQISQLSGLPAADIRAIYDHNRNVTAPPAAQSNKSANTHEYNTELPPVTRGLILLLATPGLAAHVQSTRELRDNPNPGAQILAEAIDFFQINPNISIAQWLERYREHRFFQRLQQLAAIDPPGDKDGLIKEFQDVIRFLEQQSNTRASLRQRYDDLIAKQAQGPLDEAAAKELKSVLSQLQGYNQQP